jgi:hypothetical protein
MRGNNSPKNFLLVVIPAKAGIQVLENIGCQADSVCRKLASLVSRAINYKISGFRLAPE